MGLIAGSAAAAMRGGKVAYQQVAIDALGNALGDSIASANGQSAGRYTSDDPLGGLIALSGEWVGVPTTPDFGEVRAMRNADMNPMGLSTYSAATAAEVLIFTPKCRRGLFSLSFPEGHLPRRVQ
jgi:hypothetical protein